MFHYDHQLGSNYVCLLFGAEQAVYGEFLELFHRKQLPPTAENESGES